MLKNYAKNSYLTQTDAALLHGIATKKKFRGVSTIHKGADEMIDYTRLDQFERARLEQSQRGLLGQSPTREVSPAMPVVDEKNIDKLVDFDDDEDFSGLPPGGHDYHKRAKYNRNKNKSKATTIEMRESKDQDSESRLFYQRNQAQYYS